LTEIVKEEDITDLPRIVPEDEATHTGYESQHNGDKPNGHAVPANS
jgi:hypothetical protein